MYVHTATKSSLDKEHFYNQPQRGIVLFIIIPLICAKQLESPVVGSYKRKVLRNKKKRIHAFDQEKV